MLFRSYEKSKEEIQQINQILLQNKKSITAKIDSGSDWDKLLALHDLLCSQIRYSNCGDITHSIVGPLIHKISVCEGISKTFKYLCDEINIDCIVVNGVAKSEFDNDSFENHSWNKVRINGDWLHIDATFDLTLSSCALIRHDYFCVNDNRILITHKEDGKNLITCAIDDRDYYSIKRLVMNTQQTFINFVKASVTNGTKSFEVRLPSTSDLSQLQNKVLRNVQQALKELNVNDTVAVSINKESLVLYIKLH